MQLRAVIFDYGLVLSGPPDASIYAELIRRIGLSPAQSELLYRKHRHDYDRGDLSGIEYWKKTLEDAGNFCTDHEIEELATLDARMWTVFDPALVAWQSQLRAAGIKTAILSNMGDRVEQSITASFDWIQSFDALVWSYHLRVIKPDPSIYRHALQQLGVEAREALFIDDLPENIEAARALGLQGIVYKGVADLAEKLMILGVEGGLERSFPIPA